MTQPSAPVTIEALLSQSDWVRRLAYSLTRDPAEADDLVQETWLVVAQHPPAHASNLKSWLRAVMKNVRRRRWRGEMRRAKREHAVAESEVAGDVAELAARASMLSKVAGHVHALDEAQRTVVLLRYFDDLPPRKIAERLGVPVNTVNSRIQRAHARLQELLRDEFGDGWAAALLPLLRWPPSPAGPSTESGATRPRRAARWVAAAAALVVLGAAVAIVAHNRTAETPASTASAGTADGASSPTSAAQRRRADETGAKDGADVGPAGQHAESAATDAAQPGDAPETVRATGRVTATGALEGRVTLRLTPLASAERDVVGAIRLLEVAPGPVDVRLPRTDDKGRRIGEWIVDAEAAGCLPKQVRVRMPLPVEGTDASIPEIALTPAPLVTGIVNWNAGPGQSARVATYRLLPYQGTAVFDIARIAPGGEFRVRLPPDERALVVVTVDEFLPVAREVDATAPGQIRSVGEFALSPGLSIRGRVYAEGVPLGSDRSVTVFTEKPHRVCINVEDGWVSWDGTTAERYSTKMQPGPDGSFAAGGYGRDQFRLVFYGAGRVADDISGPLLGRLHEVPTDRADLLFHGTPIDVVVTSGGAPVAAARVSLADPSAKVCRCGGLTDKTGTITLLAKPGSTYSLQVALDGYIPADGTVMVPDTGSASPTRIDLVASPKEPLATWTVCVRSAEGRVPAIAGFGLFTMSEKLELGSIRRIVRDVTPTDGVFRIENIPPGRWRLEVRPGCGWFDSNCFEMTPDLVRQLGSGESAEDEVTAVPAGRAVLEISGLEGVEPISWQVHILNAAKEPVAAQFCTRSVLGAQFLAWLPWVGPIDVFPALPPGRYTVEADEEVLRGLAAFSVSFEIVAGRVTHVPIKVTRR
jgi:RNA polymerase sigma factor (sigma-70 family)